MAEAISRAVVVHTVVRRYIEAMSQFLRIAEICSLGDGRIARTLYATLITFSIYF